MTTNDFLFEIGTEELPPKSINKLAASLANSVEQSLTKNSLTFTELKTFATPRRLALLITDLANKQPDQKIERRGPSVAAAFDKDGNPTKATLGFAASCKTTADKLTTIKTDKGEWLTYTLKQTGKTAIQLLPEIISNAIKKLPLPKAMRWGNNDETFVRPVHWLVMLYGNKVIPYELFGIKADNKTHGHRFHHPEAITISEPKKYAEQLNKVGMVIADFDKRQKEIIKQIQKSTHRHPASHPCHPVLDTGSRSTRSVQSSKHTVDSAVKPQNDAAQELLNEVTNIVEWPVVLTGTFPESFLKLPPEVITSTLQKHQKCFTLYDDKGKLLPNFITVSNIKSKKPKQVVAGNERVINARLSDAEFFFNTDQKQPLAAHCEQLKHVVFQSKLGTIYDKTLRLEKLATYIANKINADKTLSRRAALLSKADLMTQMVGEFPELQGTIGFYYAKKDKEPLEVAKALQEQYLPRFAGDKLPTTLTGCALAIADKIDTIVGIFGINQIPTGEKDPYGLRRAALGILRIIIEKQLDLDLQDLITEAARNYTIKFSNNNLSSQAVEFILERLRAWYLEEGTSPQVFAAVLAKFPTRPLDFKQRIKAVNAFIKLPEAEALAAANKRVSNILRKANTDNLKHKISEKLLLEPAEQDLAKQLLQKAQKTEELYKEGKYTQTLQNLASLKKPIDNFFDNVMVNCEDEALRNNRLALLTKLRDIFILVADISLLQQ